MNQDCGIGDGVCLVFTKAVVELGRQLHAGTVSLEEAASQVPPGDGPCADIMRHSLATAFATRALGATRREPLGVVTAAAWLHDVGLLALAESGKSAVAPAVHAVVGGELLRQRNFPPELVTAVAHHHRVAEAGEHERLAAYCFYGDMLAGFLGVLYPQTVFDPRSRSRALDVLAVKSDEVPRHIQQAQAAFAAWRHR